MEYAIDGTSVNDVVMDRKGERRAAIGCVERFTQGSYG